MNQIYFKIINRWSDFKFSTLVQRKKILSEGSRHKEGSSAKVGGCAVSSPAFPDSSITPLGPPCFCRDAIPMGLVSELRGTCLYFILVKG